MKHIYYHHHKMQNKQYNQHHQNVTNIIEKLVDKIRDNELMMINIHDDVNKLLISNDKLTKKVEFVYSNTKTTVESVLTSIDDMQVFNVCRYFIMEMIMKMMIILIMMEMMFLL